MTKVNLGHNDPGLFIPFDRSVKMREKSFIRKNGYVLDVFSEGQELEKRNCQAARLDPAGS
jgi:hypothetical protein